MAFFKPFKACIVLVILAILMEVIMSAVLPESGIQVSDRGSEVNLKMHCIILANFFSAIICCTGGTVLLDRWILHLRALADGVCT